MMTPKERFDQALKTSIRDPYDRLLSFSIDTNGVTLLQLHSDLLRDETMFENLLATLKTDLPTHFLHVSLQPHKDYNVEERFTSLQDSLQDVEGMQITQVPYQEKGAFWKNSLVKKGLIIGGGAIAAPFLVTAGIGALGFTAAGITAGSTAAGIMSAYGGTVASGSICAVMQSIGAAGLGAAGTTVASSVGAVVTGVGAKVFSSLFGRKNNDDKGDATQSKSDNHERSDDEEATTQPDRDNLKSNDEEGETKEQEEKCHLKHD